MHAFVSTSTAPSTEALSYSDIENFLDFIPVLYPGGNEWLKRRMLDVDTEAAHLAFRIVGGELAGLSIGIPKGDNRFKICTIFVADNFRRRGIGTSLLDEMLAHAGSSEVYVTGAETLRPGLESLFESRGIHWSHTVPHRYGPTRNEDVYIRSSLLRG